MTAAEKKIAAMRNNPRDWRIEDLEAVARQHGVNIRKPGGSHVVFEHPAVSEGVTVPARKPIKAIYVIRFVAMLDSLKDKTDD